MPDQMRDDWATVVSLAEGLSERPRAARNAGDRLWAGIEDLRARVTVLEAENAELLADLNAARELLRLHEVRWRPIVEAAAKWDEAWAFGNANPYVHADLHTAIHEAVSS